MKRAAESKKQSTIITSQEIREREKNVKPEKLTIERLEKESGLFAGDWHGRCTTLAHHAAKLVGGHEVYGAYHGPVDACGYWKDRLFQRHGWVLLDDGRILDPTRWSFENVDPYIYVGDAADYDEGAQDVRKMFRSACPDTHGREIKFSIPHEAAVAIEMLTGMPLEKITFDQIFWVANTPYDELVESGSVGAVYDLLIQNKLAALVPIDNVNRARREGHIG